MTDYTPTTEEVRGRHNANATLDGRTWRMADAEFGRWLAQYTAEKRAEWEAARLAEQGETEWEYGIRDEGADGPFTDHYESIDAMSNDFDGFLAQKGEEIVHRRKAGEWLPVDENGDKK